MLKNTELWELFGNVILRSQPAVRIKQKTPLERVKRFKFVINEGLLSGLSVGAAHSKLIYLRFEPLGYVNFGPVRSDFAFRPSNFEVRLERNPLYFDV